MADSTAKAVVKWIGAKETSVARMKAIIVRRADKMKDALETAVAKDVSPMEVPTANLTVADGATKMDSASSIRHRAHGMKMITAVRAVIAALRRAATVDRLAAIKTKAMDTAKVVQVKAADALKAMIAARAGTLRAVPPAAALRC